MGLTARKHGLAVLLLATVVACAPSDAGQTSPSATGEALSQSFGGEVLDASHAATQYGLPGCPDGVLWSRDVPVAPMDPSIDQPATSRRTFLCVLGKTVLPAELQPPRMAYVVFAMHAAVFGAPIKDAYKREDVKIGSPRFNELPAAAPKIPNARCKGYTWWYDVLETPESAPEAAPFRFNGRSALCLLRNRKGKYFTRGAHVFELFRPESGEERSPGFTDFAVETFREAIP